VKLFSRSSAAKALSLAAVSALVLSGCAAAPEEEATVEPGSVDFLACAVSDEGSWLDKSFNEAVYTAMTQAESDLGVSINTLESASSEAFEPNLQSLVDAGCDIIVANGFLIGDALAKISSENPDVNFALVDGSVADSTNVKPLFFETAESSFLAGYAAADFSESKIIGTYGGVPIAPVTDFMTGYYYGAMQWGLDNDTEVEVLGWDPAAETGDFMGNFDANSEVSKNIALTQLNAGADVILPVAGNQFTAVTTAIDEVNPDAVMLGVDLDVAGNNADLAPYILTSIEKRMTVAVFGLIKSLVEGTAFDVTPYVGTLDNGGTAISSFRDFEANLSADLAARLVELQEGIAAGTYKPKG
jgi:basic membrane protein A and related proteins